MLEGTGYRMIRWQEYAQRHGAPECSYPMPNGFCLGRHGRPERCNHDGSRWVAAEPAGYGFCLWGYGNDTSEVVRLGKNLSGREVERLADLFLAVEEAALEAKEAAPKTVSVSSWPGEEGQSLPFAI